MARLRPTNGKSPLKSKAETGYRAKAAKRLQTPEFQPEEDKPEEDDEEQEDEDGSWPVYEFPGQ